MVRKIALTAGLALMGLVAVAAGPQPAEARTFFSVGIGVPLVPGPFYYPPPYVYAPPPAVVYTPPPVVYAPSAPAQPAYASQSAQAWYYCDNPKGYYPYVTSCSTEWRQVPATPPASR
jgi:hypothetical protein